MTKQARVLSCINEDITSGNEAFNQFILQWIYVLSCCMAGCIILLKQNINYIQFMFFWEQTIIPDVSLRRLSVFSASSTFRRKWESFVSPSCKLFCTVKQYIRNSNCFNSIIYFSMNRGKPLWEIQLSIKRFYDYDFRKGLIQIWTIIQKIIIDVWILDNLLSYNLPWK